MEDYSKPVVLTFINNYLPGYKAGGIPRSMINTVENMSLYVDFWIVTRDRDLGETEPYKNILKKKWQRVGSAMVYYLSPDESSFQNIRDLIAKTQHDILYLNSFFDSFTIKALLSRKFGRNKLNPVIVAPRGEFASAALKIKYLRKFSYISFVRIIGLYNNVKWHASSKFEETDIKQRMKIKSCLIHTALDLPTKFVPDNSVPSILHDSNGFNGLKIIF